MFLVWHIFSLIKFYTNRFWMNYICVFSSDPMIRGTLVGWSQFQLWSKWIIGAFLTVNCNISTGFSEAGTWYRPSRSDTLWACLHETRVSLWRTGQDLREDYVIVWRDTDGGCFHARAFQSTRRLTDSCKWSGSRFCCVHIVPDFKSEVGCCFNWRLEWSSPSIII